MTTLLIDLQGQELQQDEVELLEHPLVAGLILFTRNFFDRQQLEYLIKEIRQKVKKPLLITVDQEGGRVQRFREGFTALPAMQAFGGVLNNPQEQLAVAQEAGWLMAAEMTALDIDLSFAPVLDLGHQCKAIGDRSFGETAEIVTPLARAFISGMREVGMAAIGKHFPGHGHVIADSHLETPKDNRSKTEIFNQDILPFKQLIKENFLQGIMPAHVVYTDCDESPASGSNYWLKEVLRKQLKFKGAIFSDDLGMKGAAVMGDFVERSEQALKAGCDLLLLCNERQGVEQVLDNLKLAETAPHFAKRQARLNGLFKQKTFNWSDLTKTPRYLKATRQLSQLQEQWQFIKNA